MNATLERQFASLLSALKVVSLAALVPAIYYFIDTLAVVSKTQKMASDMLPEGTSLPVAAKWTFRINDLLATNMLYLAPLALLAIGACVWVSIQSRTGHFLYLNLGLCLLLLTLGSVMRSACLRTFAEVVL